MSAPVRSVKGFLIGGQEEAVVQIDNPGPADPGETTGPVVGPPLDQEPVAAPNDVGIDVQAALVQPSTAIFVAMLVSKNAVLLLLGGHGPLPGYMGPAQGGAPVNVVGGSGCGAAFAGAAAGSAMSAGGWMTTHGPIETNRKARSIANAALQNFCSAAFAIDVTAGSAVPHSRTPVLSIGMSELCMRGGSRISVPLPRAHR